MANLILQLCYNETVGIAVDTHMQRICQKLGWAGNIEVTATAEKVEKDLEDWIPKEFWEEINVTIVGFGQTICAAVRPQCNRCLVYNECKWAEKSKFKLDK